MKRASSDLYVMVSPSMDKNLDHFELLKLSNHDEACLDQFLQKSDQ